MDAKETCDYYTTQYWKEAIPDIIINGITSSCQGAASPNPVAAVENTMNSSATPENAPNPLHESVTSPNPLQESVTAANPLPESVTAANPLPESAPNPLPESAPNPLPESAPNPLQEYVTAPNPLQEYVTAPRSLAKHKVWNHKAENDVNTPSWTKNGLWSTPVNPPRAMTRARDQWNPFPTATYPNSPRATANVWNKYPTHANPQGETAKVYRPELSATAKIWHPNPLGLDLPPYSSKTVKDAAAGPKKLSNEARLLQLAELLQEEVLDKSAKIIDIRIIHKEVWEKKRCIKNFSDEKSKLPLNFFEGPLWEAPDLQERKKELNHTKNLLNDFQLKEWNNHTKRMNPAGLLLSRLRSEIRPECCSQAWCKMFECLSNYNVIPPYVVSRAFSGIKDKSPPPFFSVHLCEAPGAFVSATNHFLSIKHPKIEWEWLATTLNPHYEGNDVDNMINEDTLILTSMNNWDFLEDSTGNIMSSTNMDSLIKEVEKRCLDFKTKVDLVTADGSIDCQNNKMEQESTVIELQFVEIVTALHILGVGGSFVLKIFTFLECQTINHLYLLTALFTEVHLFKPSTSQEGNSEVYVICLGFNGLDGFNDQLLMLKHQVGAKDSLISKHSLISSRLVIKQPFLYKVFEAAMFFTGYQMAVIKRNVEAFKDTSSISIAATYMQHELIRNEVATEWLRRYNPKVLPSARALFKVFYSRKATHVDPRSETGTFKDKLRQQSPNLLVKIEDVRKQINFYRQYKSKQWKLTEISIWSFKLTPMYGKPYSNILSSRFCFGKPLSLRDRLKVAAKPHKELIKTLVEVMPCESWNIEDMLGNFELADAMPGSETVCKFTSLCCHESVSGLLNMSDMEQTRRHMLRTLIKVSELEIGESLFLCTYPLLSRLQIGFIVSLTPLFEKVLLSSGGNKSTPRGVLLRRYGGVTNEDLGSFLIALTKIVSDMNLESGLNKCLLEMVPINGLIDLPCFDDILLYNMANTLHEIDSLMCALEMTLKMDSGLKAL